MKLPKYYYHITTKENADKIMKNGEIKTGNKDKFLNSYGFFMFSGDNFINNWQNCLSSGDLRRFLLLEISNAEQHKENEKLEFACIKIPADKLPQDKVKVRLESDFFLAKEMYSIARRLEMTTFNGKKLLSGRKFIVHDSLNEGYSLEDSRYLPNSEALEYIYCDNGEGVKVDGLERQNFVISREVFESDKDEKKAKLELTKVLEEQLYGFLQ